MAFLMAAIPLFLRMIQCIKSGYDRRAFFSTIYFLNFLKYVCSFLVAILSFATKENREYLKYWMLLAIISTVYSYIWDLKVDWGML